MTVADPEAIARRLALLRKLESKGVKRASDLPRDGRAPSPDSTIPAHSATRRRPVPLSRLFPDAERLAEADGAALWRLRSAAPTDGRPTRQGHACPVDPWGGPPTPRVLAELTGDPTWADLDPAAILYLDTETTGLATGAGSVAFLVGLGRFAPGGRFELEQYFIDDFAAEPLLVAALDAPLRAAGALVTYNGRAFDLPLLAARWIMQRRQLRFPDRHLDLLFFARRLWRRTLPDCSLGSVERHVLRLRRLSDLPSSLIPGIYLETLRGIRPERLVPVFDHHAQDIYSLAALAALLARAVREPDHPAFAQAEVQWGLARLAEARGDRSTAAVRLEAAVLAAREPDLEFRLAMHLARAYKRLGRLDDAVAVWRARVGQCRPHRLDPLIELAKHAEHEMKDLEQARRWTEQALALLQSQADLAAYGISAALDPAAHAAQLQALRRRLARHDRKLHRGSSG
jgi:uncharacterized protein YprB with RNaseH-like and TPR domain